VSKTKDIQKICNKEIFEKIYYSYGQDLKRFLFSKTKDMYLAEDILQECFLKLWNNCAHVNFETVKSYLFTVGNNTFLNSKKHEKVVRSHEKTITSHSTNESPEFLMVEQEFLVKLESVINSLPEKQKEVFLLSRMEKKKYVEIANILGISVKAVEKRMHFALKTMKEHIGRI
jgi:RNA polymerase sigma-70 factor (ECF subfamily)